MGSRASSSPALPTAAATKAPAFARGAGPVVNPGDLFADVGVLVEVGVQPGLAMAPRKVVSCRAGAQEATTMRLTLPD